MRLEDIIDRRPGNPGRALPPRSWRERQSWANGFIQYFGGYSGELSRLQVVGVVPSRAVGRGSALLWQLHT